MALIDAVARYVPGVLGSGESTEEESFSDGLLEYPQYTRPRVFEGREVPEVLLGGGPCQDPAIGADGRRCWPRCVHGRICSPQHP